MGEGWGEGDTWGYHSSPIVIPAQAGIQSRECIPEYEKVSGSEERRVCVMRDIPIVFPIALAIIVAMLLFTSAYAVSANAVASNSAYSSQLSPSGLVIPGTQGNATSDGSGSYNWYEQAALAV
jgi:hypothetical protein